MKMISEMLHVEYPIYMEVTVLEKVGKDCNGVQSLAVDGKKNSKKL